MRKLTKTRFGLYASLGTLVVVLVAVGLGVNAFSGTGNPTTVIEKADVVNISNPQQSVEEELGSFYDFAPKVFGSSVDVQGKLTQGGAVTNATSTMQIAFALTAAQVCDSNIIHVNSGCVNSFDSKCAIAASLDVTLPASSTLFADCLNENGKETTFTFVNLSPVAASTTQIVAGAGIDLLEPDESNDFDVEIGGGNKAVITLKRFDKMGSSTVADQLDIIATVKEHSAAD